MIDKERIYNLYNNTDKSYAEIAKETGVSISSINRIVAEGTATNKVIRKNRVYTEEMDEEILNLRLKGYSNAQISKEMEIPGSTISYKLKDMRKTGKLINDNVRKSPIKISDDMVEDVIKRYNSGESYKDIISHTGIGNKTIWRIVKRNLDKIDKPRTKSITGTLPSKVKAKKDVATALLSLGHDVDSVAELLDLDPSVVNSYRE